MLASARPAQSLVCAFTTLEPHLCIPLQNALKGPGEVPSCIYVVWWALWWVILLKLIKFATKSRLSWPLKIRHDSLQILEFGQKMHPVNWMSFCRSCSATAGTAAVVCRLLCFTASWRANELHTLRGRWAPCTFPWPYIHTCFGWMSKNCSGYNIVSIHHTPCLQSLVSHLHAHLFHKLKCLLIVNVVSSGPT